MDLKQMFIDIRGLNMLSPSHLIFWSHKHKNVIYIKYATVQAAYLIISAFTKCCLFSLSFLFFSLSFFSVEELQAY